MSRHSAHAWRMPCRGAGSKSVSGCSCCSPRPASSRASSTKPSAPWATRGYAERLLTLWYNKSRAPYQEAIMAVFDTLGYARFLREGGVPQDQAETHAEAARQFMMADIATKEDLNIALEMQTLRLSVRVGVMLAAGLSLMTALIGAFIKFH